MDQRKEPNVEVGILFAKEISFRLHKKYHVKSSGRVLNGIYSVIKEKDKIYLKRDSGAIEPMALPVVFECDPDVGGYFELENVTIGINFHWERKENQKFMGDLKIIQERNHLTAINIIPLEQYLKSVISSEMNATASMSLLKAHAVISRSWLISQMSNSFNPDKKKNFPKNENEYIRWYDREDHRNFDVCADDHCQRYQGITRASTPEVVQAVQETRGEVVSYNGQVCDARYSKCCGGIAESFENVWENTPLPYLTKVIDNDKQPGTDTNLDTEQKHEDWILNSPRAFCNTKDEKILSQVLNDYDLETTDFYRWKTTLTQEKMQKLLKRKLNIEVGDIKELVPVERGFSGRLVRLLIKGTQKEITIGKELVIRKAFSDSHLYSSAFVAEPANIKDGIPGKFIFKGAGWGHGVGFCQIGGAVMGARGYSYKEILAHYFRNTSLQKWY